MSQTINVPGSVYKFLSAAAIERTADVILHGRSTNDDPMWVLHLGDQFGDYLTWLWQRGQRTEVCMVLTDLIAGLRNCNTSGDPSITLEDLLAGVRVAAYHLTDDEMDDLVELAREEVPEYYGSDPNRGH